MSNLKIATDTNYLVECAENMDRAKNHMDSRIKEIAYRVAIAIGSADFCHSSPPYSFDDNTRGINDEFTWKVLFDDDDENDFPGMIVIWYSWEQYKPNQSTFADEYSFPVEFLYDEEKLVEFENRMSREKEKMDRAEKTLQVERAKVKIKELQEQFPELKK